MATNQSQIIDEDESSVGRIVVKTSGLWRVSQVVETLSALDGLSTRIAVATRIALRCEEYDYVISNLRALGLLQKGEPEKWGKWKSPTDIIARTDFVKFTSLMRGAGVEVQQSNLGLKFSFQVPDLLELAPLSSRPEIERIKMASPGEWSLLLTGLLGGKQAVSLLEKIFDALFFRKATKTKKEAEARQAIAQAKLIEAQAAQQEALSEMTRAKATREQNKLVLDHTVALDSLISTLRNAGFDNQELKTILQDKLLHDIDVLARYKSIGLLQTVSVVTVNPKQSRR